MFPLQMDRFLIISYAFSILLCIPAINWLVDSYKQFKVLGLILLLTGALGMLMVSVYSMKVIYRRNQLELKITDYLIEEDINALYSFDMDVALNYRIKEMNNINLWKDRIEDFNEANFILFNEPKFEIQWEMENPMENWRRLKTEKKLKIEKEFQEGWTLYSF
jgi:hypothetical protein